MAYGEVKGSHKMDLRMLGEAAKGSNCRIILLSTVSSVRMNKLSTYVLWSDCALHPVHQCDPLLVYGLHPCSGVVWWGAGSVVACMWSPQTVRSLWGERAESDFAECTL